MSDTQKKPYIVVLGNEKGGTGKSTAAMHIITHLLYDGFQVGTIDVDARQGTLSRYVENRQAHCKTTGQDLLLPQHIPLFRSEKETLSEAQKEETFKVAQAVDQLSEFDFIVIDTPGSDTYLSRLAHSYADTLITPLNDSFIDLDMLVRLDATTRTILRPSTYSLMVWEQKKQRALRDQGSVDWVVLRNRLSSIMSRNKEEMHRVLSALRKRIGFRLVDGFGERVIFRELFLNGLTLLDLKASGTRMTLSHVAARQELAALMELIHLPKHGMRGAAQRPPARKAA